MRASSIWNAINDLYPRPADWSIGCIVAFLPSCGNYFMVRYFRQMGVIHIRAYYRETFRAANDAGDQAQNAPVWTSSRSPTCSCPIPVGAVAARIHNDYVEGHIASTFSEDRLPDYDLRGRRLGFGPRQLSAAPSTHQRLNLQALLSGVSMSIVLHTSAAITQPRVVALFLKYRLADRVERRTETKMSLKSYFLRRRSRVFALHDRGVLWGVGSIAKL